MKPDHNFRIHNLVQNITTSLTGSLDFAGQSLRKIPFGQAPGNSVTPRVEDHKRDQIQKARRIELRVLLRRQDFEQVTTIALNTDDEELAAIAVNGLADCANQATLGIRINCLMRLAHSYSLAACRALFAYRSLVDAKHAQEIFLKRMQQEHWQYMARNGLARADEFLLFSTLLDEELGTSLALPHFMSFWQALEGDQVKQLTLLGNILGDLEPLGLRYEHSPVAVAELVKLKAVTMADHFPPDQRERLLLYAVEEESDKVALAATQRLLQYWSSASGQKPPWLEPFAMLNLRLNFKLSAMAANFSWQKPVAEHYPGDAPDPTVDYKTALETVKADLKKASIQLDTKEVQRLKQHLEKLQKQVHKLAESRIGALQNLVNQICAGMDIPSALVQTSDDSHWLASYCMGAGKILVGRDLFISEAPLSEGLMSSLLHELLHMEQDVQILRLICDDLGVIYGRHSRSLHDLMTKYAQVVGYEPDPLFLLSVLRMRDDRPLTPVQRARAQRLYKTSVETASNHARVQRLGAKLVKMQTARRSLEDGEKDAAVLSCLNDQKGLEALFQNGQIPEVVIDELNESRKDLFKILSQVSGQLSAAQKQSFNKKDKVELALSLIEDGVEKPFLPVIVRVKHVLQQVLNEEIRKLKRTLVKLTREGYHEDEAYYIFYRTKVIVKALRKGWYKAL